MNKKIPVFLFHMYVLCSNIQEQYKYFYLFFQSSGFEWGLRVPWTRSCRSHHRKLLLPAQLRENWRGQNPKRLQNEGQLPESSGQDRTAVEQGTAGPKEVHQHEEGLHQGAFLPTCCQTTSQPYIKITNVEMPYPDLYRVLNLHVNMIPAYLSYFFHFCNIHQETVTRM